MLVECAAQLTGWMYEKGNRVGNGDSKKFKKGRGERRNYDKTYLEQQVRVVLPDWGTVSVLSSRSTVYQLMGQDAGLKVPELPDANMPGG